MCIEEFQDCQLHHFKPAHTSSLVVALSKILYPLVLVPKYGGLNVEIVGDGLERLKAINTKRVIICPNHSSHYDIDAVFLLSKCMGEEFNFLTAREVMIGSIFRQCGLPLIGCFSVVRGATDKASFKETRKLLIKGRRKIMLFPEGEVSRQNDLLLPLKTGAAHVACSAIDGLRQLGKKEPVYIQPIAMRYFHGQDLSARLLELTAEIEEALGIEAAPEQRLPQRLKAAGEVVLNAIMDKYNCHPDANISLDERIEQGRATILQAIAAFVGYEVPAHLSQVEVAHQLYVKLYEMRWYERKLGRNFGGRYHQPRIELLSQYAHDLRRVINFIGITGKALGQQPTQEQLVQIIELLEEEVFGHQSIKGPLNVLVAVGEPIDVLEEYNRQGNKAKTIECVNRRTGEQMLKMLAELAELVKSQSPSQANAWTIQSRVA